MIIISNCILNSIIIQMTIDERYSAQFGAGPNHHLYGSVFTINKSSKMTTVQWDVDGDLAAIRSDVLRRCEVGSQSSITMVYHIDD